MPTSSPGRCSRASASPSGCTTIPSTSRVASKSAWRMLARDWRAGELGVLAAALVIAVASVTSVGFFADRVGQALERDAHQLLGADLVLAADHPWSAGMVKRLDIPGIEK